GVPLRANTMRRPSPRASAALVLGLSLSFCPAATSPAAALDDYVRKEDPAFAWSLTSTDRTDAGTIYHMKLTSQVWHSITWQHQPRVHEPAEVKYRDAVLLFITGGNSASQFKPQDGATGFALARLCGARVAVLPQMPNQPLLGDKSEDTLIAD